MAVFLVLIGSVLGFLSAVVSFAFLGFGLLSALALWSGVGLGFSLLGIGVFLAIDALRERAARGSPGPDARGPGRAVQGNC